MSVYEEALQAATALYGEEDENLSLLCQAAADSYTARLRQGLTADDCGQALPTAAALVAVATLRSGGAVSDFSAAAISVRYADGTGRFLEAAERLMMPYLAAGGFAFRSVSA